MDRKQQALTEEHKAQMQALAEAMEAQRQEILEGKPDPGGSTPEKSVGSSSIGNWERVNEPSAPKVGSSSASKGAEPSGPAKSFVPPPSPPKALTPPGKSSGLYTGAVPERPHSWEQRRLDQQAEEAALNEAARTRALQELMEARVAAAVEEALRKKVFDEQT